MSLGIRGGTSAAQSKEGECACCVSARISPALLLTFQSCNTMREGRRTSQAFVWRGLTIEVKAQNTSKQQCNNAHQHSLTRRAEGGKKKRQNSCRATKRNHSPKNLQSDQRHN